MVEKLLNIVKSKSFRVIFGIICLVVVVLIIYFPNYAKLKRLNGENKRLVLENEKLIEEINDYEAKIKRSGKDPFLYEKIAREDLGVAKDNEIVIDIEQ